MHLDNNWLCHDDTKELTDFQQFKPFQNNRF